LSSLAPASCILGAAPNPEMTLMVRVRNPLKALCWRLKSPVLAKRSSRRGPGGGRAVTPSLAPADAVRLERDGLRV
jgi:hypothetical protein